MTLGQTYETTRGTFKLLEHRSKTHAVLAERSDGRLVLLSLADWLTWEPLEIVDTRPEGPLDVVDE